jgi:hypothetical protein
MIRFLNYLSAMAALAALPALSLAQPPPGPNSYPGGVPRYQRDQTRAPAAEPPVPRVFLSQPTDLYNGLMNTTPMAVNIRGVADVHSALSGNQARTLIQTLNQDPRARQRSMQWTQHFRDLQMLGPNRVVVGYQNGIVYTTGR